MPKSPVTLDLDALEPSDVIIRYNDKDISVKPLTIKQYAVLTELGIRMQKINDNPDVEFLTNLFDELRQLISLAIPELAAEQLSMKSVQAVFMMLVELNTSQDKALKELADKGIQVKREGSSDPKA